MRNALIALCLFALTASAQTSNVQTVKAWKRTHVIGIPGGGLLDPTGTIADGQRSAAVAAMIAESSNIVAAAGQGLTNALQRLWDAADHTNDFTGRLYLAADMDDDPDYENIEAYVVAESVDADGLIHYYTHYTRLLETAPRTVWAFEPSPGVTYWSLGNIDTNKPLTNILGYACYDITVERPQQVGNIILRTNKFLKWGTPETPLDISDAGLEIISGGETNRPFTGSVTTTNFPHEITEVYLSGFLHHITTKEAEWVNPYVTDGLVAMWDGEWNAGPGKHDPNATVWKDLIGENDIGGFSSETHFGSSYFITGNKKNCASFKPYDAGAIKTVEIVVESEGYDAIVIVCFSGSGYANRWFGLRANKTFNFAQRGDCATVESPTSVHYYAGTSSSELTDLVPFSALYLDGVPVDKLPSGMSWMGEGFGGRFNTAATEYSSSNIYTIRLYERELTAAEIAHNYSIDKARFGL